MSWDVSRGQTIAQVVRDEVLGSTSVSSGCSRTGIGTEPRARRRRDIIKMERNSPGSAGISGG